MSYTCTQNPIEGYLPNPSILEKLKAHDEKAPERILSTMEHKQKIRETHDKKLSTMFKSKAFWRGVKSVLFLEPLLKPQLQTPARILHDAAHESWKATGDHLREAIKSYMRDHSITPKDINLTQDEIDDLGWNKEVHKICHTINKNTPARF